MDVLHRIRVFSSSLFHKQESPELPRPPGPPDEKTFVNIDENNLAVLPFYNVDLNPPTLDPTFHLFPLLPIEIRIKIWIFAHPGPRNVHVTLGNHSPQNAHRLPPPRPQHSLAFLHVNNESRAIFLEHYVRIFTYTGTTRPRGKGGGRYFNFEKDSLCVAAGLKGLKYLLCRFPEDMARIRYLDVNVDGLAYRHGQIFTWSNCPLQLSDLQELRLVTLRWVNFRGSRRMHYAFRGVFANTLEVLQIALRHQHARKDCEKETFVRLAINCIYSEERRNFREFQDLHAILFPLPKDIRERWGRMEGILFEGPGGVLPRWGWGCKSGEFDLHQDWVRTRSR
jgi:hypothetical protein